jgi:thiol-disulfide isomerase/thioredoxin
MAFPAHHKKRKTMKIVLIMLVFALLSACDGLPNKEVIFQGQIANASDGAAYLKGFNSGFQLQLDSQGLFIDTLALPSGYYQFIYEDEYTDLYLHEGTWVQMYLDPANFDESIRYSGNGSEAANYLAQKFLTAEAHMGVELLAYQEDEASFLRRLANADSAKRALLVTSIRDDWDFIALEKVNLSYERLLELDKYATYHPYLSGDMEYTVSAAYPDVFADFNPDNEHEYITYESYRQLVDRYFSHIQEQHETLDTLALALQALQSERIRNRQLTRLLRQIKPENAANDRIVELITTTATTPELQQEALNKGKQIANLTPGKAIPAFAYPDIEGNLVRLSDFAGKKVLIDVWATWCQPCLAEIPHLRQLANDNRDLAILGISVDAREDEQKWRDFIATRDPAGTQVLADSSWNSGLMQHLVVTSIPRFILLDGNGRIIDANAPRPSDRALRELIAAN